MMTAQPRSLSLQYRFLILFLLLSSAAALAQASFNLTGALCAGNAVSVTAGTGTIPANSYTWTVAPPGANLSSPNASLCDINFPAPGTYTVILDLGDSNTHSSVSHTVEVYPLPSIVLTSSPPALCVNESATLTVSGAGNYTWAPVPAMYFLSNSVAYVTPYVSTLYSVSGTSSLGCVGNTALTLVVDNSPNLQVSAPSSSACPGFTVPLTAQGAASYAWTGSTFTGIQPNASISAGPGSYTVLAANGTCTAEAVFKIDTMTPPVINVKFSRTRICFDDGDSIVPVYLNASGASQFTWSPYQPGYMTFSLGAVTAVSPSATTCYTITAGETYCQSNAQFCVTVESCLGVEEEAADRLPSVFPNPFTDQLTVQNPGAEQLRFIITDPAGRQIAEQQLEPGEEKRELSLAHLAPGIYFIHFSLKGESMRPLRLIRH